MRANQTKQLMQGALLLTIVGFVSKVLSAAYRVPLQNLTGDYGFYMYQQVYPFIGTIMILSLYGFPIAVAKVIVQLKREHVHFSMRQFYVRYLFVLYVINGFIFILIYGLAPNIATYIGDPQLTSAFQMIAFAFLLIPPLALLRGVFQGLEQMKYTALSQMIEQVIRVVIIILAAIFVYQAFLPVVNIGLAGAIATIVSMVIVIVVLLFIRPQPLQKEKYLPSVKHPKLTFTYLFRTTLSLGMVGALIHMILLIIQFGDVVTFIPALQKFGMSSLQAMELKGVFDRGQPLIQFGVVIGSSFALALVPSAIRGKDNINVQTSLSSAIRFSLYLAGGATVGLIVVFPEVNTLLFLNDAGSSSLRVLVIAILLTSFTITCSVMLQSLGDVKWVSLFIIGAFVVKYSLNRWLITKFSLYGASIGTIGSLLFLSILIAILLKKRLPQVALFRNMKLGVFIIASVGMTVYLYVIKYVATFFAVPSRVVLLGYVLFIVITGAFIYMSLLLKYDAFSDEEIKNLPFASKLIQLKYMLQRKQRAKGRE